MVAGGQIQNFSQLIGSNIQMVVPDFQRNYSWELKQVEELFTDIENTANNQDTHFLGGVIFLRHNNAHPTEPYEVVDGQQRLTTLFLLISAIRDAAAKLPLQSIEGIGDGAPVNPTFDAQNLLIFSTQAGTEHRFVAHPMIAQMVATSIFPYPRDARPKLPARHFKYSLALRRAHKRLAEMIKVSLDVQLDDETRVKYLHRLLDTIKYRLKILNVSSDSNSEAYEIFMTLNSRGMALGPSDLVKSEIFKHLTRDLSGADLELRNASLTSDWKFILTNLEDGDIEQFLRHYLVSKCRYSVTAKKIFDQFSHTINREGIDPVAQAQAVLQELMFSSKLYKYLLDCDSPDIVGEEASLLLLKEIADSYRVFALVAIDPRVTQLTDAQRVELIRLCEVIVIRWVLAGQNAQKLEDQMQALAMDLREGKDFASVVSRFKTLMASDEKMSQVFEETVDSASLVRIVLFRINRRWDAGNLITFDSSAIHVEHIAPSSPTPHWMGVLFPDYSNLVDREVEYEAATELWGNKTILEAKINQEIQQKPFAEKRVGTTETLPNGRIRHFKGYNESPLNVTLDLGTNFDAWDRDLIAARNKWIADCFVKIWSITPTVAAIQPFSEWLNSQPN